MELKKCVGIQLVKFIDATSQQIASSLIELAVADISHLHQRP